MRPAPSSISGLLLLLLLLPLLLLPLLLLPLLLLLLLLLLPLPPLLLLFGVILAPPLNEPPRDITVEGDGGLPPPRNEVPVDSVVPGSPPPAAPTSPAVSGGSTSSLITSRSSSLSEALSPQPPGIDVPSLPSTAISSSSPPSTGAGSVCWADKGAGVGT